MIHLKELIQQSPYQGYAYAYPHKTAYRFFEKPLSLRDLWKKEAKQNLFLYVHIPFCEMRCGFCNLFTVANPKQPLYAPYLAALERQAKQVREALESIQFSRVALGGGTPTYLSVEELAQVFDIIQNVMGASSALPTSVEMSPKTVSVEKLQLLKAQGVTRASIGIQSFVAEELKALGRPQRLTEVATALRAIKASGIPFMNIDLMYGSATQTPTSWQYSIESALAYEPEEIFLYPLYIRPLTGLNKRTTTTDDHRWLLYQLGKSLLEKNGYRQITKRLFRKEEKSFTKVPPYYSVEDGMVGIGVGARSYTKEVHYSTEYAVGSKGIKTLIESYNQQTDQAYQQVVYGVQLTKQEQKRRYVIKALLEDENRLLTKRYHRYFGTSLSQDFPHIEELFDLKLAEEDAEKIYLTSEGLAYSDVIGPWLYSASVKDLMQTYELR
ncbi:MAG: STM4012 family radical SAM protein [Thermonemataceae bacterium]